MVMSWCNCSCFIGAMHTEGTGLKMLVSRDCSLTLHELN